MITIFVGDISNDLAVAAKAHNVSASLITEKNKDTLVDGVYYTSFGDFVNKDECANMLHKANVIYYCPPVKWCDSKKDNSSFLKECTESYLMHFHNNRKIYGFDINTYKTDIDSILELANKRISNDPQLWVAGCSITNGVGVSKEEKYGNIISTELNLPVSFLAANGSSITWAADQILRSDIKEDDIIIWGLTAHTRLTYFDNKVVHVNIKYYELNPMFNDVLPFERLTDNGSVYNSLTSIHRVINFCKKLNVKLVIAGLFNTDTSFSKLLLPIDNYIYLSNPSILYHSMFLDIGSDGFHPGALTHQMYAEKILDKIKKG